MKKPTFEMICDQAIVFLAGVLAVFVLKETYWYGVVVLLASTGFVASLYQKKNTAKVFFAAALGSAVGMGLKSVLKGG